MITRDKAHVDACGADRTHERHGRAQAQPTCGNLCCAVQHSTAAVLWCAVLCCAVLCCAVLCCAVLCCAVLCCAVLCCAVLCCAVLCCAVLCCAVLHGSSTSLVWYMFSLPLVPCSSDLNQCFNILEPLYSCSRHRHSFFLLPAGRSDSPARDDFRDSPAVGPPPQKKGFFGKMKGKLFG